MFSIKNKRGNSPNMAAGFTGILGYNICYYFRLKVERGVAFKEFGISELEWIIVDSADCLSKLAEDDFLILILFLIQCAGFLKRLK